MKKDRPRYTIMNFLNIGYPETILKAFRKKRMVIYTVSEIGMIYSRELTNMVTSDTSQLSSSHGYSYTESNSTVRDPEGK